MDPCCQSPFQEEDYYCSKGLIYTHTHTCSFASVYISLVLLIIRLVEHPVQIVDDRLETGSCLPFLLPAGDHQIVHLFRAIVRCFHSGSFRSFASIVCSFLTCSHLSGMNTAEAWQLLDTACLPMSLSPKVKCRTTI